MTRNRSAPHSPWLRWSALLATALLAASCGGGTDAGGDYGGDSSTPSESVGATTLEAYQSEAREACSILQAPIADDPVPYAAAASTLAALDMPADPTEAATAQRLADAMQGLVQAHTDLVGAIGSAVPGFESPPGTWMVVESGTVHVSESGEFAEIEESGVPQEVGLAFVTASDDLGDAASEAGVPECAPEQVDAQ